MGLLIFVLVLLLLILVHEFGHFIVAKKSGIRVDEFGFGFPPKLYGKKFGETEYTFNLLPIGGFVRIFGENPDEESIHGPDSDRSFVNKPKAVQAAVLFAGVFFNWLLAWALLTAVFVIGVHASVDGNLPSYASIEQEKIRAYVVPGGPAYEAGLRTNAEVVAFSSSAGELALEGVTLAELTLNMQSLVTEAEGEIAVGFLDQNGEQQDILIQPEKGVIEGYEDRRAIGVALDRVGIMHVPLYGAVLEGAKATWLYTKMIFFGLIDFFMMIFSGAADFSGVSGPVGIVQIVGDNAAMGIVSLLSTIAIISINLAILNLLPVPALDGGRLLFLLIEAIKGSRITPKIANTVNAAGFMLLMLLMLIITYHDIVKLLQ